MLTKNCRDSKQKFSFGLVRTVSRLRQLVNNKYLSDVAFKVGAKGELIYAHKLIITMASEVFYAQFNGHFAESGEDNVENPIVVVDIEPDVFLKVMYFIYCEDVFLTYANVVDMFYAAQKYLLKNLIVACESYFGRITDSYALSILNRNHLRQIAIVDQKCLSVICDNPLRIFSKKEFLTSNRRTVELIAAARTMNCQKKQLEAAINRWKTANKLEDVTISTNWEALQCSKLSSYSTFRFEPQINTDLILTVQKTIALYGLGIFVGIEQTNLRGMQLNLKITIEGVSNVSLSKVVRISPQLYIHEVVHEKVLVRDEARIRVTLENQSAAKYELFCLDEFKPVNKLSTTVNLTVTANSGMMRKANSIAYLLYNYV